MHTFFETAANMPLQHFTRFQSPASDFVFFHVLDSGSNKLRLREWFHPLSQFHQRLCRAPLATLATFCALGKANAGRYLGADQQ